MASSSVELNARLRARKRCIWIRRLVVAVCLLGLFSMGELIVKERIAMGHTSRVLISSVKAADFLKYKDFLRLPASQPSSTRAKTNVTETNHTGQAFYRHYGDWADGAKGLLINHCDIDQLTMVMNKKIDTTYCGPGSSNSIGCVAGYYRDILDSDKLTQVDKRDGGDDGEVEKQEAARTNGVSDLTTPTADSSHSSGNSRSRSHLPLSPGVVKPCPSGFFCPSNQVCFIICARGAACNASRPIPYETGSTTTAITMLMTPHGSRQALSKQSPRVASMSVLPLKTPLATSAEAAAPTPPSEGSEASSIGGSNAHDGDRSMAVVSDGKVRSSSSSSDMNDSNKDSAGGSGGVFWTCYDPITHHTKLLLPYLPGCPGARFLTLCPAKFFCASPVEMAPCPRGHYCPVGSAEPIKCLRFHQCDEPNLQAPQDKALASVIVLGTLLLLFLIFHTERKPRTKPHQSLTSSDRYPDGSDDQQQQQDQHQEHEQQPQVGSSSDQNLRSSSDNSGAGSTSSCTKISDGCGCGSGCEGSGSARVGDVELAELSNGSDGLVGIGGAQATGDLSSDAPKEDAGGREGRVRGGKGILHDLLSPLDSGNNDGASADAQVYESGQEGGGYEGEGQDNRDCYLYGSVAEADPPMDIQFQGLGLKLNETGAQVLRGVTGEFKRGRVAAIMGPSGVGKTTFLNTLCGRTPYGTTSGYVTINPHDDDNCRHNDSDDGDNDDEMEETDKYSNGSKDHDESTCGSGSGRVAAAAADESGGHQIGIDIKPLPTATSSTPLVQDKKREPKPGNEKKTRNDKRMPQGRSRKSGKLNDSLQQFTHLVGFVPQEDVMHGWLTVQENLWLYARLKHRERKLHSSEDINVEVNFKVKNLMKVLGLYHVRNSVIGDEKKRGISGGQRKRVNVGMELVLCPSVLFLDEPTTGLDSTTSLELVHALRSIAEHRSLTIAAVIHQPSSKIFNLFNDVLLLGEGGATVYLGPTSAALPYFTTQLGFQIPPFENPADFFLDVISAKVPPASPPSSPLSALSSSPLLHQTLSQQESGTETVRWTEDYFDPESLPQAWEQYQNIKTGPQQAERVRVGLHMPEKKCQEEEERIDGTASAAKPQLAAAGVMVPASPLPVKPSVTTTMKNKKMTTTNGYGSVSLLEDGEKKDDNISEISNNNSNGNFKKNKKMAWRDRAALAETFLPSWLSVFRILLVRALIEHIRFPFEFLYEILVELLTGFVVGALYTNFVFHDLQQMNFMMSLAVGFTLALSSMRVFGPGMLVFWREAAPGTGMGLSKSALFVSKCCVELPRMTLLVLALEAAFYPLASPRCPFPLHFAINLAAAWAVTGMAFLLSVAQDPKSAQLSVVVVLVLFAMFCGVAPRLSELSSMGPLAQLLAWASFARWFIESLYTEETIRMSDAWRMPPPFYDSPSKESALLGLRSMSYVEGSTTLNLGLLAFQGILLRLAALACMGWCNRDKMGLPPLCHSSSVTTTTSTAFSSSSSSALFSWSLQETEGEMSEGSDQICEQHQQSSSSSGGRLESQPAAELPPLSERTGTSRQLPRSAHLLSPQTSHHAANLFLQGSKRQHKDKSGGGKGGDVSGRAISMALLTQLGMAQEENGDNSQEGSQYRL